MTIHTPKSVMWDIARADPLFAKLAKIDPLLGWESVACSRLAFRMFYIFLIWVYKGAYIQINTSYIIL